MEDIVEKTIFNTHTHAQLCYIFISYAKMYQKLSLKYPHVFCVSNKKWCNTIFWYSVTKSS